MTFFVECGKCERNPRNLHCWHIMFACSRGSFVVVLFEYIILSSHVLLCCIDFEGTTAMRFAFV